MKDETSSHHSNGSSDFLNRRLMKKMNYESTKDIRESKSKNKNKKSIAYATPIQKINFDEFIQSQMTSSTLKPKKAYNSVCDSVSSKALSTLDKEYLLLKTKKRNKRDSKCSNAESFRTKSSATSKKKTKAESKNHLDIFDLIKQSSS